MTRQPGVIRGTFSDFKLIRTRGVCQLILEIPLEAATAALVALGGIPNPASETWVEVCLPDLTKAEPAPKPAKTPEHWDDLLPSKRAGIRCSDTVFRKYLLEGIAAATGFRRMPTVDEAAAYVRSYCKVTSRSELNTDVAACLRWNDLDGRFVSWSRGYDDMTR